MRNFIPTEDLAKSFCVKGSTVRRAYCVNGHYMGIRPKKMPNGRLLWPAAERDKVIDKAAAA